MSGTQSIERAALLVRLIASRSRSGMRLAELVQHSRLEHPTVRRILKCLIVEGLVSQDEQSRRYFLGPLIFELGLAAAPQFNLRDLCRETLDRLAERTGDTVFLTVRSGYDSVCIDRREGSFPIKALTLDIGTRRPLGVGAGGLALLMPLPDSAVDRILAANAMRLASFANLNIPTVTGLVDRSRRMGYALNDRHVTPGAMSVGLPIVNPFGDPFAAISVGAIESRMSEERQQQIATAIREEIRGLERGMVEATRP